MKTLILMTTILAACSHSPTVTSTKHVANASVTQPAAIPAPTAELAGRRAQLIGWLHDYQVAGVYPSDALGMPRSVFVDEKGVRCPMAELIWRSGHTDLVEAVAKENNEVRLADVKDGPLWDWMVGSGLTVDEIAMVQGAMEWSMNWQERETEMILAESRGQVRGRLEVAERALRDGTARSLEVAATRLPNGRIPVAKVTGAVLPVAALKSKAPVAATPVARIYPRVRFSGAN
ncbi:MAG: hypothetical protein HOV81_19810 [Kofleriaceae bacterium]|nr:hypothetical protein [Kofleriaceae bacterium]